MKRLTRTGRLFAFLRTHRHELFDDAFQDELAAMYSDVPRGTPPKRPALLAMTIPCFRRALQLTFDVDLSSTNVARFRSTDCDGCQSRER